MSYFVLVLLTLTGGSINTEVVHVGNSLTECFEERDKLVWIYNLPTANRQAVCVRGEE